MRRPQFTLRTLLVAMLVVAAFFGGIHFERERRRCREEAIKALGDAMQAGTHANPVAVNAHQQSHQAVGVPTPIWNRGAPSGKSAYSQ